MGAFLKSLLSRKFLAALVAFVALQVAPGLPASTQAKYQALVAGVYVVAQAFADAFAGGKPSQGETK